MKSVAQVKRWPYIFGGQTHEGWLPNGAAIPPPTPEKPTVLDLQILANGDDGFILEWCIRDGSRCDDSWHRTIDGAKHYAERYFGVPLDRWG